MRPDRIIVGEVPRRARRSNAAGDEHRPRRSMTTIHANSPRDAFTRLEPLIVMAGYRHPVLGHPQTDRLLDRPYCAGECACPVGKRKIMAIAEMHRHGGRRGHPAKPDCVRHHRRGCQRQTARVCTDRRASPGRASGSAPNTTAKPHAWRRRSPPPRSMARRAMPMDSQELLLAGLLLAGGVFASLPSFSF